MDRIKDTLKVSGVQVSPTEIETVLRSHPSGYIADVSVAGVPGIRTADEKVPRAWIVLSQEGKTRGEFVVAQELDDWVKQNLSSYKWLRGGIEFISEVRQVLVIRMNRISCSLYRSRSFRQGRPCDAFCKMGTLRHRKNAQLDLAYEQ